MHALHHTFGTHLSKNGVPPRTAQAATRHSSLDFTMSVYTDPSLLGVAGGMAALYDLSLGQATRRRLMLRRTNRVAPGVPPASRRMWTLSA